MIVHNKGKYIRHIGEVRLLPGANQLSEKESKSFKADLANPLNQKLVDDGEIEVVGADGKDSSNPLAEINAGEAIELILDTFDISLLEEWASVETRKTVAKAIKEQIEAIKNPPEDKVVNTEE